MDIKFRDGAHRNYVKDNIFERSTNTTQYFPYASNYKTDLDEKPNFLNVFKNNRFENKMLWDIREKSLGGNNHLRCHDNEKSYDIYMNTMKEVQSRANRPNYPGSYNLIFSGNISSPIAKTSDPVITVFYCNTSVKTIPKPRVLVIENAALDRDDDPRLPPE